MENKIYSKVLKEELLVAVGCTEPIAVAYASAKARDVLGSFPKKITVRCSGNIIKNVKAVTVPGTGNMTGIDTSSILGAIVGKPELELALLNDVNDSQIDELKRLITTDICKVVLVENIPNLYIEVIMEDGDNTSSVEILDSHNNIIKVTKNGETIFEKCDNDECNGKSFDINDFTFESIMEYVNSVPFDELKELLSHQIKCNVAIGEYGLKTPYGSNVGKTIINSKIDSPYKNAKAVATSGSDARMNGCVMPVVINSGSGNQGMTVTSPVVVYARENNFSEEKMYRALALSNLISIYVKSGIGKLSAFCGAVNAACGAGCGIAYLHDEPNQVIIDTITNCLANVGGIACDGAKSSCAAKIASSLDGAFLAYEMAKTNNVFQPGEGLVEPDIDKTIRNFWRMGKDGMKSTDVEILSIMIGE